MNTLHGKTFCSQSACGQKDKQLAPQHPPLLRWAARAAPGGLGPSGFLLNGRSITQTDCRGFDLLVLLSGEILGCCRQVFLRQKGWHWALGLKSTSPKTRCYRASKCAQGRRAASRTLPSIGILPNQVQCYKVQGLGVGTCSNPDRKRVRG